MSGFLDTAKNLSKLNSNVKEKYNLEISENFVCVSVVERDRAVQIKNIKTRNTL